MASNVVGQVSVLVVPDGSNFAPQLQQIINRATGQAGAAVNQVTANVQQAANGAAQLGQSIDQNVTQRFAQAAVQAAAFTGAVYATRSVIEGLVNKLAGLFDQLAQARAGFNAIAGEKAGGALLEEIRQFAKESPFVTQELVNYSQQLLGVGMASEKIVPLLKDTGNVIASVGGDTQNLSRVLFTLTQIQTVGRLTGQDAMQLQSALIPITKMLGEYLGKTTQEVKKLQEQGRITAEQVVGAISMAGQKVPGAMDSAVRNIAGARSVLSDTITIMMQDAPALNAIYDDIVKGIQNLAAKLGDPEVQATIQDALAAVGQAYETLKPVITTFMETMGEGSLSGLKVFTTILSTLSSVLDAMPAGVLEILGKALAAIALLKAPMMLMQYVNQFKTMASIFQTGGGLTGMVGKVVTATTAQGQAALTAAAANEAYARSLSHVGNQSALTAQQQAGLQAAWNAQTGQGPAGGRLGFMRKPIGQTGTMVASGAMMMGGMMLQGSENAGAQAAGSILTGAGMGMMMGGPVGAVVGGAAGGLIALFNAEKKAAEKHIQDMKDAGKAAATGYMSGIEFLGKTVGEQWDALEQKRLQAQGVVDRTQAALKSGRLYQQQMESNGGDAISAGTDAVKIAEDVTNMYGAKANEIAAKQAELEGNISRNFEAGYEKLGEKAKAALDPLLYMEAWNAGPNGAMTKEIRGLGDLEKAAEKYGLTLDEVATLAPEEIARIITAFEGVDDATQAATLSAIRYNKAFEDAKQAADALYGPQMQAISNETQIYSARKSAIEAVSKAYKDQNNVVAQLEADRAVLALKSAAYTNAYYKSVQEYEAQGMTQAEAAAKATQDALAAADKAAAGMRVIGEKTISQLSDVYGVAEDRLIKLLGLQGKIDPNLKIVVTADTQDALLKLAKLLDVQARIKALMAAGQQPVGDILKEVNQQIQEITQSFATTPPSMTSGKTGGGGGQSFEDKVKSAAAALESAIKSAMSAAESAASAWKSTIKEGVQYEAAVSSGRAMRNVRQQIEDIGTLRTGISALKARGLSEEALAALDINALTDVRQVKKLLSSSPDELKQLSSAISERDRLASTLSYERMQEQSRKNITLAIVEAARILGYKVDEKMAEKISAQFNITGETDLKGLINDLLGSLSGGKVSI